MEDVKTSNIQPESSPSWNWTNWIIIGLILLFFALAVEGIDSQSLWRDEALTVGRIQQPLHRILANRNIVQGVESPDLHPPLYFIILKFWSLLAGTSEFTLRYLSLIAIVIALALFAAVGRRIWSRETGVWAVALGSVSSFYLWYAQEARMYTLIVMLTLLFLFTLWPLIQGPATAGQYFLCALIGVLLIYTHYTGLFLVGFAAIALLLSRLNNRQLKWPIIILIGLALLTIPLYSSARELVTSVGFIAFQQRPLWDLLREIVNTLAIGSTIPVADPGWRIVPFVLLAIVGIPALAITYPGNRKKILLFGLGGLMITLLLFYLASFVKPNYSNPRHLTILSPILILLMAQGLATIRRFSVVLTTIVALAILVAASLSLWQTKTSPPMIRDDVRSLAALIEERAQAGDAIVWHDAVMMQTYDFYAGEIPYTAIPTYGREDLEGIEEQLTSFATDFQRIWFVTQPAPANIDPSTIPQWFDDNMTAVDRIIFPASWATLDLRLYKEKDQRESLPENSSEVDISVGSYNIRGWRFEPSDSGKGGGWLTVYWAVNESGTQEPVDFCLSVRDSADVIWTKACTELAAPQNLVPDESTIFSQQLWLPVPDGLAPIAYRLVLDRFDQVSELGSIVLEGVESPFEVATTGRFENGISFVDVEWTSDEFQAGLWATGYPLWSSDQPVDQELRARYRLVNVVGDSISESEQPLGPADYRVSEWKPGEIIRDFLGLALSFDTKGWYQLQVGLLDKEGNEVAVDSLGANRYWLNSSWIHISEWPFLQSLPNEIETLDNDVRFGESIRLRGYQVTRGADRLEIDLYWQTDDLLEEDLGVFVHIGQPDQIPVLQSSGEPAQWARPTSTWREDEIIHDQHIIPLSSQVDLSNLEILTGLYHLQDPNSRLPVTVNSETLPGGFYQVSPLP